MHIHRHNYHLRRSPSHPQDEANNEDDDTNTTNQNDEQVPCVKTKHTANPSFMAPFINGLQPVFLFKHIIGTGVLQEFMAVWACWCFTGSSARDDSQPVSES